MCIHLLSRVAAYGYSLILDFPVLLQHSIQADTTQCLVAQDARVHRLTISLTFTNLIAEQPITCSDLADDRLLPRVATLLAIGLPRLVKQGVAAEPCLEGLLNTEYTKASWRTPMGTLLQLTEDRHPAEAD